MILSNRKVFFFFLSFVLPTLLLWTLSCSAEDAMVGRQFDENEFITNEPLNHTAKKKRMPLTSFKFFGMNMNTKAKPSKKLDIIFVASLFLVALIAYIGRRTALVIVDYWAKNCFHVVEENFSQHYIDGFKFKELSWNSFLCYATGRRNCKYMRLILKLIPRQCIWQGILLRPFLVSEDIANFEIVLDNLENVIFAICGKRDQGKLLDSNEDLKMFTKTFKSPSLPNYRILSETSEGKDLILQQYFLKNVRLHEEYIKSIHISDRYTDKGSDQLKKVLKISLRLPHIQRWQEYEPVMRFVMDLIDFCAELQFPDKVKSNVKSKRYEVERQILNNSEEAQEALDKKRQEKKKTEDEMFDKMTPEQQRKYEEKQFKKQQKSKLKKI